MGYLVVKSLSDLLRADVVDEFRGRLDADLGLYLFDKGVGVHLALVEALVNII